MSSQSRVVVALLRGVNVGGHGSLRMDDLRAVCARLGLGDARTYLQSGNVVCRTGRADLTEVASDLAQALHASGGVTTAVVLRTAEELAAIVTANPFPTAAESEPSSLVVLFPSGFPSEPAREALLTGHGGPEALRFVGRELVVHYGAGMAHSKLSVPRIERYLGTDVTGRNWNTVTALLRLARELEAAEA